MTAAVALMLWQAAAAVPGLATPGEVGMLLDQLGDADLVLMNDPRAGQPARVLLATRVRAPAEQVRQVLATPASYGKAMPAFRRVATATRRARSDGGTDLEVAWELDIPLWNLKGKLWLRPRADGVDLELAEGDLAPGLFHLTARPAAGDTSERTLLIVEGVANVRDANLATRQLAQRSPLAEPAMTLAAAYVMLKSLAGLAEDGQGRRPSATLAAPEATRLDSAAIAGAVLVQPPRRVLLAAVRSLQNGRLADVEVAGLVSARAGQRAVANLRPERFRSLPGWKKVELESANPDTCQDPGAVCWVVENNLPVFSLDGTWKIRPRPWRARMVAGEREGALMGVDVVSSKTSNGVAMVLMEHPRLDRAGYMARKLIAAEPYLEHGLALALTVVEAASLVAALERD